MRTASGLCAALVATAVASSPLALGPSPAQAATPCRGEALVPDSTDSVAVQAATLCLINRIRASHGLRPLRANRPLLGVASSQVRAMVSYDYFADVRPTGQTPLALVGVSTYRAHAASVAVGQNIAWGTGRYATPRHIVAEWMASLPHRAVILTSKYRDAGVGVADAVPGVVRGDSTEPTGATYAMEFGVRL